MSLPASGPLSMSMVRTEMSQSNTSDYAMYFWVNGNSYSGPKYFSPINVLSSGSSRFSESTPIGSQNYLMSTWYGYDHTLFGNTATTYSLYYHSGQCYSTTMLPIEVGTSNTTLMLNASGTLSTPNIFAIYYGKPWNNNGTGVDGTIITSSGISTNPNYNISYQYNYVYNASLGSKIYFIISNYSCFV